MKSSIDSSSSNSSFSGVGLLFSPAFTTIEVLISVGLCCLSALSGLSLISFFPSTVLDDMGVVDSEAYEECLPEFTSLSTISRSSTIASSKLSLLELIFFKVARSELPYCWINRSVTESLFCDSYLSIILFRSSEFSRSKLSSFVGGDLIFIPVSLSMGLSNSSFSSKSSSNSDKCLSRLASWASSEV
jgi:hypothetical protein